MKNFYLSPRVSSRYVFCPFPFVLDSYAGCPQFCRYCFSYWDSLLNKNRKISIFEKNSRTIDLDRLERILAIKPKNKNEKELCEFVKRRIPIHWGGLSDPFSFFEKENKTSLKILKLFKKYEYPFIVSTKNHRIVEGEYFDLLKECKYKIVQVSLISLKPELEKIEPHPEIKIKKRLDIIKKCSEAGIRVVIRIQPFIPNFCEDGLEDLIKEVSNFGAKAITIEYLKLPSIQMKEVKYAIRELSEYLGYNLIEFYKKFGVIKTTDYELKPELKKRWILKAKELAYKYNLEFYCADNEFRYLGDSNICCGVGNEDGFQNVNEVRTGKIFELNKNIITLDDIITDDLLSKLTIDWLNLGNSYKCSKRKKMTLLDNFIRIWNDNKLILSPSKFYINIKYVGKDSKGNAIYCKIKE